MMMDVVVFSSDEDIEPLDSSECNKKKSATNQAFRIWLIKSKLTVV
jgi:hypothetical protein